MKSNVELVKSFYANDESLFNSLDENIEWHETEGLPYGGKYRGKQAVLDGVFSHVLQDWDNFGATPHTVLAAGNDKVITLGYYSGVFKKTGKAMKAGFAHIYTLRNGKIVEFRQYGDSAVFREAMV